MSMKTFTYNIATFCLALLFVGLMGFENINAQAPCDDPDYYLSFAASAPACFGESTGTATAASSKCPCMFSGCNWEWSYEGVKLEGEEYNYKTITGLKPGVYTATVYHDDDDLYPGCVLSGEVIVPEAPKFVERVDVKNIACKGDQTGGSISIIPAAGYVGLLSYEWSTGHTSSEMSNLASGDYSVTITQYNGCSVVENFTIAEPEALDFNFEAKATCPDEQNGSVEVIPIGGTAPYSYLCDGVESESARMENIAEGAHLISVIDANGCILERTIEVEKIQIFFPEITLSAAEPSICEGGSLTLSSFNNNSNNTDIVYDWSPKEGIASPSTNLIQVSPTETTEYTLTVSTEDGDCQIQNSVIVEVNKCDATTGLFDISQDKLSVFPNPTQSDVFLDLGNVNTNANLNLIDITGKSILSMQSVPNKLELSDLPNGIYYLHISNNELQIVEKIIKN